MDKDHNVLSVNNELNCAVEFSDLNVEFVGMKNYEAYCLTATTVKSAMNKLNTFYRNWIHLIAQSKRKKLCNNWCTVTAMWFMWKMTGLLLLRIASIAYSQHPE